MLFFVVCSQGREEANGVVQRLRQLEQAFFSAPADRLAATSSTDWKTRYPAKDRNAQVICTSILSEMEDSIREYYPFDFECTCRFRALRASLTLNCETQVCIDDVAELYDINIVPALASGAAEQVCFASTYTGTLKLSGMELSSTMCSGSRGLALNLTGLEEEFLGGMDLFDPEQLSFDTPQVCASLKHRPNEFSALESCSFSVEGENCPCEVCSEEGTDIQLLCPDLLGSYIPEVLRPHLSNYTTECVGTNTINELVDSIRPDDAPPSDAPSDVPSQVPSDLPSLVPSESPSIVAM